MCLTVARAVVNAFMSGTAMRWGNPEKHSTITNTALFPSAVVHVKVLWSIQNLDPKLSG